MTRGFLTNSLKYDFCHFIRATSLMTAEDHVALCTTGCLETHRWVACAPSGRDDG